MIFDPMYMLMVMLPGLAIAGLASLLVKSTFSKYSKIRSSQGYTGAEAAGEMLRRAGITGVQIVQSHGFLSDHYNPMTRTLALSKDVYHGVSLSAVGVACHEAGHAIQHARNYFPLHIRSMLVPAVNLCSSLYAYVIFAGFFIRSMGGMFLMVGFAMGVATFLFSLVTLPVEWDASRRAKEAMVQHGMLARGEEVGAAKVLNAAFLTYVASLVSSLLTLLYFAMRLGLLGRNDD